MNGPLSSADLSEVTSNLFLAASGAVAWEHFLADLSSKSGDICTHIFGYDSEANITMDLTAHGYAPDYMASFNEYYADKNAWGPGFSRQPAGIPIDCEIMCGSEDLKKTEFYNDWIRPQENVCQGGGALLFKNDTRVFAVGGNIREKDEDKLKENWLRIVNQLIPHMRQAFDISRRLASNVLETSIITKNGMRARPGIFLISETGKLVYANAPAEDMLTSGIPVRCNADGGISYRSRENELFQRFTSQNFLTGPPSLSTTCHAGGAKFELLFAKLSPRLDLRLPSEPSLGLSSRCTLLIVSKLSTREHPKLSLREEFGLTPTEVEIVELICAGNTIREIHDLRRTSENTVRTQVKSAMSKLGVRRQSELIRLVHRLSD